MKRHPKKQPARISRTLYLSIGITLLCNACMINVPLPSQAQNRAEAINEQDATPCPTGNALEKSIEKNLSNERDIGASGFGFSRITEAAAILDPTGIVGAARTGHGAYQIGKVSVDTQKNHDDCVTEQRDLLQKEPDSDPMKQ